MGAWDDDPGALLILLPEKVMHWLTTLQPTSQKEKPNDHRQHF
jgi:hypothetical protein